MPSGSKTCVRMNVEERLVAPRPRPPRSPGSSRSSNSGTGCPARTAAHHPSKCLQRRRPAVRSATENSGPSSPLSLLTPATCPITWRSVTGHCFAGNLRHVRLDLVVELQPVLLQQHADGGRGERRGGGADPEPRLGVTGTRFSRSAQPKPSAHTMSPPTPTATDRPGRFCSVSAARTICTAARHGVGPLLATPPNASRMARPEGSGAGASPWR